MSIVILVLIGLAAGVLGGLFGIGGGILIVPALVMALGFTQLRAQGTSLVALIAPVGIFGLVQYYKEGNADLKSGAWIAATFMIGAYIGARIAHGFDEVTMRRIFAVFLIVVAIYLIAKK